MKITTGNPTNIKSIYWYYAAILLSSILISIFDILAPRGNLTALLYLFPLLMLLQLKRKHLYTLAPLWFTIISILAAFLKPATGITAETVIFNRSLAILSFWLISVLTRKKDAANELVFRNEKRLRVALQSSEQHANEAEEGRRILDVIIHHIREGIAVVDSPIGTISTVSEYGLELLGLPREEVCGISMEERPAKWGIYKKDGKTLAKPNELPLARSIEKGDVVENEEWMIKKPDGSMRVFAFSSAPIVNAETKVTGAVSGWRDITAQKSIEETLRRNEYEVRTLVNNSPDLIFRVDNKLRYVYVNPAYERVTGLVKGQLTGKTNSELGMEQELVALWQSSLQLVIENGRDSSVEYEMTGLLGKRYFLARLIPEFSRMGLVETVLVISRDITERKHIEEQIRYISFHDKVTGLFNRAFFEEELRRIDSERELPISIIMGDVNNLKLCNDVFGHTEGDTLLITIAEILRKACRQNDIIARWGGDEFVVILPKTDFGSVNEVYARIKQAAAEFKNKDFQPSIALGVSTKVHNDQNIYSIIRQAEERMYKNKIAESRQNKDVVLESLLVRARERNAGLAAHIERSNTFLKMCGNKLGLSETQMDDLFLLIKLHAIGDVVIPAEILKKPGRLTLQEWDTVKKRSDAGMRIVKTFTDTARISDEIYSQGERWDGSGYPRGLKEKETPYLSRIFAVIDVYDIITHERPYARTFSREEAIEELKQNAGKQFDPELVKTFISSLQPELQNQHSYR